MRMEIFDIGNFWNYLHTIDIFEVYFLVTDAVLPVHSSHATHSSLTHWPQGNFNKKIKYVIFKWILVIDGWGISCEIALI